MHFRATIVACLATFACADMLCADPPRPKLSPAQRALKNRERIRGARTLPASASANANGSAKLNRGSGEITARGEARAEFETRPGKGGGFGKMLREFFKPQEGDGAGQPESRPSRGRRTTVEVNGRLRVALANANRNLAKRLAQIDKLRDRAIDTGSEQLAKRADQLETIARRNHAKMTANLKAEAQVTVPPSAPTEPTQPTDPMEPTSP